MHSTLTTYQSEVRNGGDWIDLIDFSQARESISLVMKIRPTPLSNKPTTVDRSSEAKPPEIGTIQVGLQEIKVPSW